MAPTGDEFAALRPYVVGDELRRVHWRTSARLDTLMTRREERPWQGWCTVLLDVRQTAHDEASFERTVSAAASVASSAIQRGESVRLLTTAGFDSGHGTGRAHLDHLLEELAVVGASSARDVSAALPALRGGAANGTLVMLTGQGADLGALPLLQRSFATTVLVTFDRARVPRREGEAWTPAPSAAIDEPGSPMMPPTAGGGRWNGVGTLTLTVAANATFAQTWERAMGPPPQPLGARGQARRPRRTRSLR